MATKSTVEMNKIIDRYKPVWTCIYCGRGKDQTTLGQEHIIPFALGGRLVLPRSSCTKCSKITGAMEGKCMREMFAPLRTSMKAPTRHLKRKPKTAPVIVQDRQGERTIDIPIENFPFITVILPQLDLASLVAGRPSSGRNGAVWRTFHASNGAQQLHADGSPLVGPTNITIDLANFYRFLCKIAHCFAVGERGLSAHRWLLPPLILGTQSNFSDLIGGVDPLPASVPTHMGPTGKDGERVKLNAIHELRSEYVTVTATRREFLTVVIRLLFDFTPEYRLVVAEV